jgi:large subunit ribosomal protein L24
MAARIKKGDTVEVTTGRDRGKRGTVLRVDPERGRVTVERVNIVKKHQKPNATTRQGGIIEKEASLHLSNVALIHKGEKTRVAFREVGGKKLRWSKKHDEAIDG